jgi:hypothetical protein
MDRDAVLKEVEAVMQEIEDTAARWDERSRDMSLDQQTRTCFNGCKTGASVSKLKLQRMLDKVQHVITRERFSA